MATGRKKCHKDGPSGANDVSCNLREETEGEKGTSGKDDTSPGFASPFAHAAPQGWLLACVVFAVQIALTCRGSVLRSAAVSRESGERTRMGCRKMYTPWPLSGLRKRVCMYLWFLYFAFPCLILQNPGCFAISALRDRAPALSQTTMPGLSQQERQERRNRPVEERGRPLQEADTKKKKADWVQDRKGGWNLPSRTTLTGSTNALRTMELWRCTGT